MSTDITTITDRKVATLRAITGGAALAPVHHAHDVLSRCCIIQVDPKDPRHLPFALADDRENPPIRAIADARSQLIDALTAKPVPAAVMELAFARMLGGGNHKTEDHDAAIDGLVDAVGLACDPLARQLGYGRRSRGQLRRSYSRSRCVSCKQRRRFCRSPRKCARRSSKCRAPVATIPHDLGEQYNRRLAIDECILINGPQSDDPTFQVRRRYALGSARLLQPPDDVDYGDDDDGEQEQNKQTGARRLRGEAGEAN